MIRGVMRDAQTNQPIAGVPMGGRTITDGEITAGFPAVDENGEPLEATDTNGSFDLAFDLQGLTTCPPPDFPRPDQVEIIVVREGCEQVLVIEVNDDTVVVRGAVFPNDTLELTAPVLVPPCEPPP